MTRPGEADAVEAAMALYPPHRRLSVILRADTEAFISVAYPVIAAAVREQVAQDIEAYGDRHGTHSNGEPDDDWTRGAYDAADIARGVR